MAATGTDGLTPKQEAFALAYFETGNAAEAYRRAYDVSDGAKDSWVYVEACQLLDHPKIAPRIRELRDQAAQLSIYTRQQALEEYEEARALAMKPEVGNPSAAVAAIAGKVKLFGLDRPGKVELTGKDGGPLRTEDAGVTKLTDFINAITSRNAGSPC